MDAQKFGAFITRSHKEKNMTQADLAAKLQVTDKAVSRWEGGIVTDALKLAKLLQKQERKNACAILGITSAALIFILCLDNMQWHSHCHCS